MCKIFTISVTKLTELIGPLGPRQNSPPRNRSLIMSQTHKAYSQAGRLATTTSADMLNIRSMGPIYSSINSMSCVSMGMSMRVGPNYSSQSPGAFNASTMRPAIGMVPMGGYGGAGTGRGSVCISTVGYGSHASSSGRGAMRDLLSSAEPNS